MEYIEINKVKQIDNYRTSEGEIAELMQSIKSQGLLQPIGLNAQNEIVFGNRRFQACKKLGLSKRQKEIVYVHVIKQKKDNMVQAKKIMAAIRDGYSADEAIEYAKEMRVLISDITLWESDYALLKKELGRGCIQQIVKQYLEENYE